MLTVSEAIVRSAAEREESRGAHWRLDFPDQSREWGTNNIIVYKASDRMQVTTCPVRQMPPKLAQLVQEA